MILQFYVVRNYGEPAAAHLMTNDQKFNSFLNDAQAYFSSQGKWRVVKDQLFRQVVYSFFEEAEFAQKELQHAQRSTQIRLTKEALRQFTASKTS